MKSKTSFFNRKLMAKNTLLYWPVWAVYLAILVLTGPMNLWFSLSRDMQRMGEFTKSDVLGEITGNLDFEVLIWGIAFMAVITAMALFSYLYNSRSANMMHAFPLTRLELYGTNLVTGLVFLVAPLLLCFILDVFICLGFGVVAVEYFGVWLLVGIAVAFIMYGLAVFCAMLTGQLFALPVYYLIVNLFYFGIRVLIQFSIGYLGFGIGDDGVFRFQEAKLNFLTPVYRLCVDVKFRRHMVFDPSLDYYVCDDVIFQGGWTALAYAIAGIAFMVFAYFIYRKRNVEQAGDLITVSFLKPIFRWGVGICGGIVLAYIVGSFINMVSDNSPVAFACSLLIGGLACFTIAEMLLCKNFRVWNKRLLKESVGFVCFALVFFFAVNAYADRESHFVPNSDNLKYASMYNSYRLDTEHSEEAVDDIIRAHQMIVDYLSDHDQGTYGVDCTGITFNYRTKGGKYIYRFYIIPYCEDSMELLAQIREIEGTPDYYIDCLFSPLQDAPDAFAAGELGTYDANWENYKSYSFGDLVAPAMARAIQADIRDGNLQQYNLLDPEVGYGAGKGAYAANLSVSGYRYDEVEHEDFYDENSVLFSGGHYSSYVSESAEVYVSFGVECEHIIDALLEYGVIDSLDDLHVTDPDEAYVKG